MASVTVSHPLKSINAQLPSQSCSHATYALRFADPSLTSEALRHEDSRSARPMENGDVMQQMQSKYQSTKWIQMVQDHLDMTIWEIK